MVNAGTAYSLGDVAYAEWGIGAAVAQGRAGRRASSGGGTSLRALSPNASVGSLLRGRPETVLVQVDDGFVVVKDAAASRSAKARESAVLPRPEAITQLVRAARSNAEATVGVRLPADVCFARNVELPVAARNDLRRILDFDLERATPFKHRDVYTAHLVEGEAATKGKLRVRQLVTKREAVDPLVAEVRAAGLEVGFVDCWDDQPSVGMPINFLEPRGGAERGAAGFFRPVRVLAGAGLVAGPVRAGADAVGLRKRAGGVAGQDGAGPDTGGGGAAASWNAPTPQSRTWRGCRT